MAAGSQTIEAVEYGDGKQRYVVGLTPTGGDSRVKEIGEHQPQGPGDVWIYGVTFEDGSAVRVFNMTRVFYGKPQTIITPPSPKLVGI